MMSLWDALRMNMMISYQELVRTFPNSNATNKAFFTIMLVFWSLRLMKKFRNVSAELSMYMKKS